LYNWYAVNSKKLAPAGWHIPSDSEWNILENYLTANGYNYDGTTTESKVAKSLASKTGWPISTALGAIGNDLTKNNSSKFSAFPAGYRGWYGIFDLLDTDSYWWTTTESTAGKALIRRLNYNYFIDINKSESPEYYGFAIRCVMN